MDGYLCGTDFLGIVGYVAQVLHLNANMDDFELECDQCYKISVVNRWHRLIFIIILGQYAIIIDYY